MSVKSKKKEELKNRFLIIADCKQLVCVCNNKEVLKCGKKQKDLVILNDVSVSVDRMTGKIVSIGSKDELCDEVDDKSEIEIIDASNYVVLPGLIDGHTHPVWSGNRVHEFKMKLAGASYMDIHKQGGGIGYTVKHTHESSEEELLKLLEQRLDRMLKNGTTVIEAKSGYGLDLENELKMLRVLYSANIYHPIDIVSNYCGAHSIPQGLTEEEAANDIINNQIPEIMKEKEQEIISPTLIDVFCEKGVFELETTKRILKAGLNAGLEINIHADEIYPLGGCQLAGEMRALAVSHCEKITKEGMQAMLKRPTVAVVLPTTAYLLKLEAPPVRDMINAGIPIALGSDFNPNAHAMSLPFVMNMACVLFGMTMEESLVACTINSAASMGISEEYGSIESGKFGDFIFLEAERWEHLIYELVDPPIKAVVKKGKIVYDKRNE